MVAYDVTPWSALQVGIVLEDLVAELVARPAFHADALCKEHPEISFFPTRGEPLEPAKEVCRQCLVRAECLSFALAHGEEGVWGATSEKQRKNILNGRVTVADVLAALDARTGSQRVTAAVEEEDAFTSQLVNGERFPCHSCEQLFAIDELVLGHWCQECW